MVLPWWARSSKPTPSHWVRWPPGCWDLLPVLQHTTAEYAYLRQTTRTNNAAVVAEGASKPTSVYSVTRIEQSLAVRAAALNPRTWTKASVP